MKQIVHNGISAAFLLFFHPTPSKISLSHHAFSKTSQKLFLHIYLILVSGGGFKSENAESHENKIIKMTTGRRL